MNLSKALKQKRDAERRLEQTSPTKVFTEVVAGEPNYNDLSGFATKKQLTELEIKDLADVDINYLGNAGKVLKVNESEDGMILGEGGGGGIAEIPQATETTIGGIKVKARTTELNEVAIDEATGKLYAPSAGIGGTDAESILTKPISIPSFVGKDGYVLAYNETTGEFYLKQDGGGGGGGGITKSPIPFASSEFDNSFSARYAFDSNLSTYWAAIGAIGQFIGLNFRTNVLVSKISIADARMRLKDFIFEGSMDNVNYNELLNTTHPQVAAKVEYDIPTSVGYIYFRVRCTSALYTGSNMTIDELEMEYQVL